MSDAAPGGGLPRTADVVIVGGGVIGAATAFFAARRGRSVVLLERRPALGSLSTSAATGAFRLQFDNPEELALVRESVGFFAAFAERTGLTGFDPGIRRQGYLWCARTAATAARQRAIVERQRAWGLADVELLDGAEARRRFPYLAPDVVQARWRAGDGWLDPKRLTQGFARASGATIATGVEVRAVVETGGRVTGVRTDRGDVAAGAVVVAAGPFTRGLLEPLGVTLPIENVRRMRLVLPDVPEVPRWAPMTIDEETGAHWRPWRDGAHGMWTDPGVVPEPALANVPGSDDFAFALLDPARPSSLAALSPFWAAVWRRGDAHWFVRAGQYDVTPDHRPLIGPLGPPGLFVHAGYSGHGIMTSAGGARVLADTLDGTLAGADNPFRPDRDFAARERDVL